jgi:hypothetical protein
MIWLVADEIGRLSREHLDRGSRRRLRSALLRLEEVVWVTETPTILTDARLHSPGLFAVTNERLLFVRDADLELTWEVDRRRWSAEPVGGPGRTDVLVHGPDGTAVLGAVGEAAFAVELVGAIGPTDRPGGRPCPACDEWLEPPLWRGDPCAACGVRVDLPPPWRLLDDTVELALPDSFRRRALRDAIERLRTVLAPTEHVVELREVPGGLQAVTDRRVIEV